MNKFELVKRNTVEIITEKELLERIDNATGYAGYEPTSRVHIGWLVWIFKVKDLVDAGVKMKILEATWHGWINDKGSVDELKECSRNVREVFYKLGINVDFIDIDSLTNDKEYWRLVIKIAKSSSLARIKRALSILGRKTEDAELDFSKLIYPLMQVADSLYLGVDIALGGLDQRKAHMLARDVAEKLGLKKPIAIHTPVLTGLSGVGKMTGTGLDVDEALAIYKMSKSRPGDAIYIDDPPEDIERKILKAYCPPREVKYNPVLEIAKYLIIPYRGELRVETQREVLIVRSQEELDQLYSSGQIHPHDLKRSLIEHVKDFLSIFR